MMAIFSDVRVARKVHAAGTKTGGCDSCRRDIKPGETYSREAATPFDDLVNNQSGQWAHMKVHYPYGSCLR